MSCASSTNMIDHSLQVNYDCLVEAVNYSIIYSQRFSYGISLFVTCVSGCFLLLINAQRTMFPSLNQCIENKLGELKIINWERHELSY